MRFELGVAPSDAKPEPEIGKPDQVRALLEAPLTDLPALRMLTFGGCPSENVLRSTVWRVLLGYLPAQVLCSARSVTNLQQLATHLQETVTVFFSAITGTLI